MYEPVDVHMSDLPTDMAVLAIIATGLIIIILIVRFTGGQFGIPGAFLWPLSLLQLSL